MRKKQYLIIRNRDFFEVFEAFILENEEAFPCVLNPQPVLTNEVKPSFHSHLVITTHLMNIKEKLQSFSLCSSTAQISSHAKSNFYEIPAFPFAISVSFSLNLMILMKKKRKQEMILWSQLKESEYRPLQNFSNSFYSLILSSRPLPSFITSDFCCILWNMTRTLMFNDSFTLLLVLLALCECDATIHWFHSTWRA